MGTQWLGVKIICLILSALDKCPLQDCKKRLSFKTPQGQKEHQRYMCFRGCPFYEEVHLKEVSLSKMIYELKEKTNISILPYFKLKHIVHHKLGNKESGKGSKYVI